MVRRLPQREIIISPVRVLEIKIKVRKSPGRWAEPLPPMLAD